MVPALANDARDGCATLAGLSHDHGFGQGGRSRAEGRVVAVALLTVLAMFLEIATGLWSGSLALLADGVHMAGHGVALGLAASAYSLTRRYARDRRFSLGSGKINDLAAYSSAILLAASTLWMMAEALQRLFRPEPIEPLEALAVAALGLLLNLLSAWLLAGGHEREQCRPRHEHHPGGQHHHGHDHNLQAALTHVLADAATSIAAMAGLLGAWAYGWLWLDPLVALAAAVLILRWAWGLLRQTGAVLLDAEGPAELRRQVRQRLEAVADSRVTDLHLWSVGQGSWTLVASLVSHRPTAPEAYKQALADLAGIHHPMVEIHPCWDCGPEEVSP